MKPFFSVVIPTLNEEHYLPVLLKAFSVQTYRNFEVIVVDGNSDDQTRQRARDFRDTLPLSFYSVKKRSVSFQRNYGASRSKGTYLIFMDADCNVDPDFVEKLRDCIIRTRPKIIFPKMRGDDERMLVKSAIALSNYYISISQKWEVPAVPVGMCVMERALFNKLGGYTGEEYQKKQIIFPEDQEIIMRAKKTGITPYYLDSLPYTMSLRRFRKDGLATVYSRYLYNMVMISLQGKLKLAPLKIKYEQGGHVYTSEPTK